MQLFDQSHSCYKKLFGSWGESCVDIWMQKNDWSIYRKNLKISNGEIDRIYKCQKTYTKFLYCFCEIKTIFCKNRDKFFSIFTENGLSALIKHRQVSNLYKISEHFKCMEFSNLNKRFWLQRQYNKYNSNENTIYIRFFIVLKMYENYEKERFFQNQKIYKVCEQTKNYLIFSFTPEYRE